MTNIFNVNDYSIICKEIGKENGKIIVYEIKSEITNHLLNCLSLRSKLNPELRYFVIKKENKDIVIKHLNMHTLERIPALIKDLVVEL